MPCLKLVLALFLACSPLLADSYGDKAGEAQPDLPSSVKIPEAPMLPPEEALKTFSLAEGFEISLAAAEPDIADPVAGAFDGDGRLWVIEMRGYMPDPDGKGEEAPVGRVVVLEDKDDDGVFDSSRVFIQGLVLPRALALVKGGILLAEPPNLWFVADENGKAGKKTLIDADYAAGGNPEHQPNGLIQGLDNWIYSAKSDRRYRMLGGKWIMEKTEFRGQWGITQDDLGRLYYNDNSKQLSGDAILPGYAARIKDFSFEQAYYRNIVDDQRVYPGRMNPGINRGYQSPMLDSKYRLKNFTAACGPALYRAGQFPAEYYGNAFVMEPAGNLVKRNILDTEALQVRGKQAWADKEFLSSTDERFRPVNAYPGPDGSLYILDMYRGLIQHKTYLTTFLRKQVEARRLHLPIGMGRIYRISAKGAKKTPAPRLNKASASALVEALSHSNGWWRDTAQRLLLERQDRSAIASLKKLATSSPFSLARVHALWTLEGLKAADARTLLEASQGPDSAVRSAAIQVAESLPGAEALRAIKEIAQLPANKDAQRRVSLQALLSLGNLPAAQSKSALHELEELRDQGEGALTKEARQSSLRALIDKALPLLLKGNKGEKQQAMELLASQVKEHGAKDFERFLSLAPSFPKEEQEPLLAGLAEGTRQRRDPLVLSKKPSAQDLKALGSAKLVWPSPKTQASKPSQADLDFGKAMYEKNCMVCHSASGDGLSGLGPPLRQSQWLLGAKRMPAAIVLGGMEGPVEVNGKLYQAPDIAPSMPGFASNPEFTDESIAKLLSYARQAWGHEASPLDKEDVASARRWLTKNPDTLTAARVKKIADSELPLGASEYPEHAWQDLFDGKTLKGWTQKGGKAKYKVSEKSIVGTTVNKEEPNSFLCTEREYADFVLELEFKVDAEINSGIQVRSQSYPSYQNGRVHGTQIEIDPSPRGWTGGIYDEGRRNWLYTLDHDPAASKAYKPKQWNQLRAELVGASIRTWVNGVPVADLEDSLTLSGFIALQVHQTDSAKPLSVRWRKIRIKDLGNSGANTSSWLEGLSAEKPAAAKALISKGGDLSAWQMENKEGEAAAWPMQDGVATVAPGKGSLETREKFQDFVLHVEFKVNSVERAKHQDKGNSGLYLQKRYEVQILDSFGLEAGKQDAGAIYLIKKPDLNASLPALQWQSMDIAFMASRWDSKGKYENTRISVRYNGKLVQDDVKVPSKTGFGSEEGPEPGPIKLQDHGNPVQFRNVWILPVAPGGAPLTSK